MNVFEELVYGDFLNISYGPPWTISKTIPIIWSSLDISKENSKGSYLIFV
jgi:hypothetical protein